MIDGLQNLLLGATVWQSVVRQAESNDSLNGQHEPQECRKLLDASSEQENFLPEFRFGELGDVKTHDGERRRTQPPPSRRAWDTEVNREGHVSGVLDELAEPVVIALLRADRARHADDDQPAGSCPSTSGDLIAADCDPAERKEVSVAVCRLAVRRQLAQTSAECPCR